MRKIVTVALALACIAVAAPVATARVTAKTFGKAAIAEVDPLVENLAYYSTGGGNDDIYMVDDKLNALQLTSKTSSDKEPAWSPDASTIAYTSDLLGEADIYTLSLAKGSTPANVTVSLIGDAYQAAWSPDGSHIAFTLSINDNPDIWITKTDGTEARRLTDDPADDEMPTWSPDGSQISFSSNRDGSFDIYVMNADGMTPPVNITPLGRTVEAASDWSPRGDRIAFVSNRDGDAEIFTVAPDGSGLTQITHNNADERDPDWSPGGDRLAFASDASGDFDLYVTYFDGSGFIHLTDSTGDDLAPDWRPTPGFTYAKSLVTLSLSRKLIAKGVATSPEQPQCSQGSPIQIQRFSNGVWGTVKQVTTNSSGAYKTKIKYRPGSYRAFEPRGFVTGDTTSRCNAGISGTKVLH